MRLIRRKIYRPSYRILIYSNHVEYFEYPWVNNKLKSIYIKYIRYIYENY